ncbi:MAG: HAD-IA family hydrolase [Chloroflexota bacterium]|nr:HAD-IA family hydrolase [Chloroflexota bacterium]MDQ5867107.1 HAD-IA family hydrolase [Chloroflexota bacterium]
MSISTILFDLDGTLINSIDHIVDCWQHTVRTGLGREISREEVLPTIGRSLQACFEEMAPGRSDELYGIYTTYERDRHDANVQLIMGTREVLDTLLAQGYKLGVVTSKVLHVAMSGLELFQLDPYFQVIITQADTERHKPYPDPLLVACERLGVLPADAVYVGDAWTDIEAGKAAGLLTVGVTWGAAGEAIREAEPDYILATMTELPGLLKLMSLAETG